jgi:DNA-binding response OmpR family regulator
MERQYQILIIDDDNDILSRYQVYFTKQGFTVKVAHDGIEGLEKLREIDFDVA